MLARTSFAQGPKTECERARDPSRHFTGDLGGKLRYLWRAVGQYSAVVDMVAHTRKETKAARRYFRKLLNEQRQLPLFVTTNKLMGYVAAKHDVIASVPHCRARYVNNRAEVSHEHTSVRERPTRDFCSDGGAQRFVNVHSQSHHRFGIGSHSLSATNYRCLRSRSYDT